LKESQEQNKINISLTISQSIANRRSRDAAIAGQGILYEIVQMAQLDGYKTGGTIHIVINNQVGFTTNYRCTFLNLLYRRSQVTLSPVLHVNADDAEQYMRCRLH
jgi:2-oxoglutarate dehydrogenase E1 component